jgi:hypothetical protein
MWVRIARFEGAEDNWDERIEEVGRRMRGDDPDSPMTQDRGLVKRAMMLVDRENGRGAGLLFCETEDELRRLDEAMGQMNPPPGGGKRSSVEMYEVAVDVEPS